MLRRPSLLCRVSAVIGSASGTSGRLPLLLAFERAVDAGWTSHPKPATTLRKSDHARHTRVPRATRGRPVDVVTADPYLTRDQKELITREFREPSDGLEPSTPPYHGGFVPSVPSPKNGFASHSSCVYAVCHRPTQPFLRDPEPPGVASNLSPKPVPSSARRGLPIFASSDDDYSSNSARAFPAKTGAFARSYASSSSPMDLPPPQTAACSEITVRNASGSLSIWAERNTSGESTLTPWVASSLRRYPRSKLKRQSASPTIASAQTWWSWGSLVNAVRSIAGSSRLMSTSPPGKAWRR